MPGFLPWTLAHGAALGLLFMAGCAPGRTPDHEPLASGPAIVDGAAVSRPALPATWPATASAPFGLTAPGVALGVRLVGARAVGGRWTDDDLRFAGALGAGTELRLRPRLDGIEDVIALERAPGQEQVDYALDVGSVAGLRLVDRVVELLDAQGTPRFRMERPYITGADGRVAQADVALGCAHDTSPAAPWGRPVVGPGASECRLTVSWSGRGVRYPAALDPVWTLTGAPIAARQSGSGVLLPGGRVLLVGGEQCVGGVCAQLTSSELYDPATGTWAVAAVPHAVHLLSEAVTMPGQGVVLLGGVQASGGVASPVVEIYRFATSTWEQLAPMPVGRIQFSAVGLPDGKRLVAIGGHRVATESALAPVDTFDLSSNTWSTTGALKQGRTVATATLLPDGKVLVAGGIPKPQIAIPLGTVELYDPAAGGTATSLPDLVTARLGHSAHRLTLGGKSVVLAVGGLTASCEAFDVEAKTWSSVGAMASARGLHASVVLPDGSVLALGGIDSGGTVYAASERFDPATLTWKKTQPMSSPRSSLQAVTLADGRVLIAGGTPTYFTGTTSVPTAEVFDPLAVGQPCSGAGDCRSLHCTDGVCCATACEGVCESCVAAKTGGATGVCAPIADGQDPDDECDGQAPVSCGRIGTCDGAGQCALFAAGTLCGAATCAAGVGNEQRCDGAGVCTKAVGACAPYRCKDPTACATDCDADEACEDSAHCTGKQCVDDLAPGSACTRSSECTSGHCVDGVCCESSCQGPCQACAQALKQDDSPDGLCRAARGGLDPHGSCAESPVASCGRNGLCDGEGGCAFYPAGTLCQSAACASDGPGLRSERYECDGAGTCSSQPEPCGLYGCFVGDCRTTCASDADCLDTAFCQAGACVARREAEKEQACSAGNQCLSGFCVDGFCCNTPCQGSCEACDAAGARGSCVAVAGEPHGDRAACPAAPAGQPCQQRVCDGATRASCAGFVGPAVTCREPSCAQAVATLAGVCDGEGRCPEAETARCEPFVCRGDACAAACTSDADCGPTFRCDQGDCVTRTVALCDGDQTLINPDGTRTPCAPYRCEGSVCKGECDSVLDCVLPTVCDADSRTCLPPRPNPDESAGCHVASRPGSSPALFVMLAALLLARRSRSALASLALGLLGGCSDDPAAPSGPAPGSPASAANAANEPPAGAAATPAATADHAPAAARASGFRPAAAAVRVTLPARATSEVRLEGAGAAVAFRMPAARGVDAAPVAGGVDFAGGLGPGTTVHLRRTDRGVEDSVTFERAPRDERVDYALDVSSVAGLRLVDRSVEFLDGGGAPRLRMEAPYIVGADGQVAPAGVELGCAHDTSPAAPWGRPVVGPGASECRLTVSWSGRGVRYPAVLDPAWTTTASLASTGRRDPTHALLPDGRVMMAGGLRCDATQCFFTNGTELYDPATGTWALSGTQVWNHIKSPALWVPTLGLVTLAGEDGALGGSVKAEYYVPATGKWTALPPVPNGRYGVTATLLADSKRIAVIGGAASQTAPAAFTVIDVLDTTTQTWVAGGSLQVPRIYHAATRLPDGTVLVTGGSTCEQCGIDSNTAELYDPDAKTTTPLPVMPAKHGIHTGALLTGGDGQPLVVLAGGPSVQTTLFDPATKAWTVGPPMLERRAFASAAILDDSTLLLMGGLPLPPITTYLSAERFDPVGMRWLRAGETSTPLVLGAAEKLADGRVMIAGGVGDYLHSPATTARVDLFRLLDQAAPCTDAGECASRSCVDGVCCATACDGVCESCVAAKTGGATGVCAPVADGQDPDDECTAQDAASCGLTGACDGGGQCALFAAGTGCGLTVCIKGVINSASCDGAGQCATLQSLCAPFVCQDSTTCAASCQDDLQCATEAHCEAGVCVADLALGAACARTAECTSGQCADGVCCESACQGPCQACAQALKQDDSPDGLCRPVRAGTDPHDSCAGDPVESCDLTGQCDGGGKCALFAAGTTCRPTECVGAAGQAARSERHECDGAGTCAALPEECGLYACAAAACLSSCQSDQGCAAGARCVGGQCQAQGKAGAACAQGPDCLSGFCVDGVCCNTACQGGCEACAEPGAAGSCIPVTGAPRPGHAACPAAPAGEPCQQRVCDGATRASCAGWAGPAVSCRAPSCAEGVATLAGVCDGQGACPDAVTARCEPFACRGDACAAACAADSDCAAKFRCDQAKGDCVPRTGAFCTDDRRTLVNPDGTTRGCAPYACEGSACKTQCSSVLDCVAPSVCDQDTRACVAAAANPDDAPGCQLTARRPGSSGAALLGLLGLLAGARRARRSRAA